MPAACGETTQHGVWVVLATDGDFHGLADILRQREEGLELAILASVNAALVPAIG
jgi:hypothetical protein